MSSRVSWASAASAATISVFSMFPYLSKYGADGKRIRRWTVLADRHDLCRHPRESGDPGFTAPSLALGPRFRGDDEERDHGASAVRTGLICGCFFALLGGGRETVGRHRCATTAASTT